MEVYSISIPAFAEYVGKTSSKVGTLIRDDIFARPEIQELCKVNSAFALFIYFLTRINPKTKNYEVEKEALKKELTEAGFNNILNNIAVLERLHICTAKKLTKDQLTLFAAQDSKAGKNTRETKDQRAKTQGYSICKYMYDKCAERGRPLSSYNYHINAQMLVALVKEYGPKEIRASVDFFLNDNYWKENFTGSHNIRNNFGKFHEWYLKTVKMPYPKNKDGLFCSNYDKLLHPADDREIPFVALDFENKERRLRIKGLINEAGLPTVDPSQFIEKPLAFYIHAKYTKHGKDSEPEWHPFYLAVLRDHKHNGDQQTEGQTNEEGDPIWSLYSRLASVPWCWTSGYFLYFKRLSLN